jgi:diguanylate cyclase (GGDEF)-like protein
VESFHKKIIYDGIVLIFAVLLVLIITINVINKFQKKLTKMAYTDPLSKLLNRRGFDMELKQKVHMSSTGKWSVYIMDIDNFKYVNDKFGHLKGDEILSRLVQICNIELKEHVLARWGGDEFSGIIEKSTKEAYTILEILRNKIKNDKMLSRYNITVSIGIEEYNMGDTVDSIITRADKKMYMAKAEGKNRIVY